MEISTSTLMLAIGALAREIEQATQEAENASVGVDDEEHLSERVLDLQRALSELAGIYERQRSEHPAFPSLDQILGGRTR
jgi:hypothetical protein